MGATWDMRAMQHALTAVDTRTNDLYTVWKRGGWPALHHVLCEQRPSRDEVLRLLQRFMREGHSMMVKQLLQFASG